MDVSLNAPLKAGRVYTETVWLPADAGAIKEGMGLCYNWDYGTAADADASRYNRVEKPTILNARHFAGVAARAYSACTGGQLIEIYRPGSVCKIRTKFSTTIGVGIVTCQAGGTDAGYFTRAGFEGEGSAVPLQTNGAATELLTLAVLQTGLPSGLVEVVTPVVGTAAENPIMVGGVTYFAAATLTAGNAAMTLANGTISGLRKKFVVEGTQTTNNVVITVTAGKQALMSNDPTTTLATITMDDISDLSLLQWADGAWDLLFNTGAVLG